MQIFSPTPFSRSVPSGMRNCLGLALLTFAAVFFHPAARAQNSGPQNGCIDPQQTASGVTLVNSCSFRVHVYWVFTDKPSVAYNNYIEPSGSHETLHKGSIDYYTCAADYFVVDQWGNIITHQVSGFGCRKK